MTNILTMKNKQELIATGNYKGYQIKNFKMSENEYPDRPELIPHIMMAITDYKEFKGEFGSKVIITKLPEVRESSNYLSYTWTGDDVHNIQDGISEEGPEIVDDMIAFCDKFSDLAPLKEFLQTARTQCFTE